MWSESAQIARRRPFYASRADAYDTILNAAVDAWVAEVRHLRSSGSLLDAGCGTGRHAQALALAGFEVEILDASSDLLAIARRRSPELRAHLGDICTMRLRREFDIVTCRGVLNDMVTDEDRVGAVERLAAHVAPGGFLIVDVREREATRVRAGSVSTSAGQLPDGRDFAFTSSTRWADPLLIVSELHVTSTPGQEPVSEPYEFTMRPWTRSELTEVLQANGLSEITVAPARYRASNDRLFVTAHRPE